MSDFDMSRMQQDAVNRVREMQRRAKSSLDSVKESERKDKPHTKDGFSYKDKEHNGEKNKPPAKKDPPSKNRGMDLLRMFNFSRLEEDSDRSLILLILILIAGDECDELLILALIYLLI